MKGSTIFNIYWYTGCFYTGARSYYWLNKVNDKTYTEDGYKYHPLTTSSTIKYTAIQGGFSIFWPLFMLSDLSDYEKRKMGIKDANPPFPFETLKWKES